MGHHRVVDPRAHRPSADDEVDFEALVVRALDELPEEFRQRLGTVAVVVQDEPTAEQLARTRAGGLLGLYEGVPRTVFGATLAPVASKITIFRGPHVRRFRNRAALEAAVGDTVRHEVAHHFGISDARLGELAAERGRQRGGFR
jgi:predicted Zn-dependent protease with MMP-like domain